MNRDQKDSMDDGRTIADMSFLKEHPMDSAGAFGGGSPKKLSGSDPEYSRKLPDLGKGGKRAAFRGALGATLLIGAVYIGAAAVLIGLMIFVWSFI